MCRGVGAGLLPCTAMGGTGTTVLSLNGSWDSITPGVKQRKVGRKWEKSGRNTFLRPLEAPVEG